MAQANWSGATIAASDTFEQVEGNVYFPPNAVESALLRPSETTTRCPWKGEASYFDVVVDGQVNKDAAWTYTDPKPAAANIKDHIAFWRGVGLVAVPDEVPPQVGQQGLCPVPIDQPPSICPAI